MTKMFKAIWGDFPEQEALQKNGEDELLQDNLNDEFSEENTSL